METREKLAESVMDEFDNHWLEPVARVIVAVLREELGAAYVVRERTVWAIMREIAARSENEILNLEEFLGDAGIRDYAVEIIREAESAAPNPVVRSPVETVAAKADRYFEAQRAREAKR